MAKERKKQVRENFREAVFKRDGYQCRLCPPEEPSPFLELDAHHITDRNLMPNGGYVASNGISVCSHHHIQVEAGIPSPEFLYRLIGSSFKQALEDSTRLS